MSRKKTSTQAFQSRAEAGDRMNLKTGDLDGSTRTQRDDGLRRSPTSQLPKPLLEVANTTNLPGQTDLSENHRALFEGTTVMRPRDGQRHGEVSGRFHHSDSACRGRKNVLISQPLPTMLFQDRDQHGQPIGIQPGSPTLGRAEESGCGQRLNLNWQEPGPRHGGGQNRPGRTPLPRRDRHACFIQLSQTQIRHLEKADLLSGSESVLRGPQDTMAMIPISLKGENRIHDMLQELGSSQLALLGDMTDDHDRRPTDLGRLDQVMATPTQLSRGSRGRVQIGAVNHLDRIEHHHRWLHPPNLLNDPDQIRISVEIKLSRSLNGLAEQSIGSKSDLLRTLFTAGVENPPAAQHHARRGLKKHRALADSWFTAEQNRRTGDESATKHAIQLTQATRNPGDLQLLDFRQRNGSGNRPGSGAVCGRSPH